jgi:hypothetical protein
MVTYVEGGQFNYLNTSEIWPGMREVAFGGSGLIRGGLLYN